MPKLSPPTPLSLIILAGGRSSRMGQDKASLPWHGTTLLQDMIWRSQSIAFAEIIISANEQPDLSCLPPEILSRTHIAADRHPGWGPLGGMEAAFRASTCSYCLVLSVDLPFYDFSPVKRLLPELTQIPPVDLFLPMSESRPQPLAAVYRRGPTLKAVQATLTAEKRRVLSIVDALTVRILDDAGSPILYTNINTPSAYKDALAIDINRRRAVPVATISAGRSGSGKTALAVEVIAELTRRGCTVGYIKSTHHHACQETPSSDTARARRAGAAVSLLCSPDDIPAGQTKEQFLYQLSQQIDADLVLIESRSHGLFPILYIDGTEPSAVPEDKITARIGKRNCSAQYHTLTNQLDAICAYILYITKS